MATKRTQFRLSIVGNTEDVPRLIRGYGKLVSGEVAVVLRPAERKALLVRLATADEGLVWESDGTADYLHVPERVVSAKEAVQLAKAAQKPMPPKGSVTLRGTWTGLYVCDDNRPRIQLKRKLATYGTLFLTSSPEGGWEWEFQRSGKWFANEGVVSGYGGDTLVEALQRAVLGAMEPVKEACSFRDTHRRREHDPEWAAAHPLKAKEKKAPKDPIERLKEPKPKKKRPAKKKPAKPAAEPKPAAKKKTARPAAKSAVKPVVKPKKAPKKARKPAAPARPTRSTGLDYDPEPFEGARAPAGPSPAARATLEARGLTANPPPKASTLGKLQTAITKAADTFAQRRPEPVGRFSEIANQDEIDAFEADNALVQQLAEQAISCVSNEDMFRDRGSTLTACFKPLADARRKVSSYAGKGRDNEFAAPFDLLRALMKEEGVAGPQAKAPAKKAPAKKAPAKKRAKTNGNGKAAKTNGGTSCGARSAAVAAEPAADPDKDKALLDAFSQAIAQAVKGAA